MCVTIKSVYCASVSGAINDTEGATSESEGLMKLPNSTSSIGYLISNIVEGLNPRGTTIWF